MYALQLGGARLLHVGDVVLRVPLEEATVSLEKRKLTVGERSFYVMWGFRKRAETLAILVEASQAPPGPS